LIRRYLRRVTGYSRPQLTRLIAQYLQSGRLVQHYRATTTPYARKFTTEDIVLLAELDSLHGTLSGPATRVLLQRAFHRFGQALQGRSCPSPQFRSAPPVRDRSITSCAPRVP
jgi:hypothetical protein